MKFDQVIVYRLNLNAIIRRKKGDKQYNMCETDTPTTFAVFFFHFSIKLKYKMQTSELRHEADSLFLKNSQT